MLRAQLYRDNGDLALSVAHQQSHGTFVDLVATNNFELLDHNKRTRGDAQLVKSNAILDNLCLYVYITNGGKFINIVVNV